MPKAHHGAVTGRLYQANMFLFVVAAAFGAAFIATSMSSRFFKWKSDSCLVAGSNPSGVIVRYDIDMKADIGWRKFTMSYLEPSALNDGCFGDLEEGATYLLGDYQDNNASMAGLGMVASWGVAIVVALLTLLAMFNSRNGYRRSGGISLVNLNKLAALMAVGIVVATTVFWWLVEGKFGSRQESLAPRLLALVQEAASRCNTGTNDYTPCTDAEWEMITPGWSLVLGIIAMFAYGAAVFLLWCTAERVDALNNGTDELAVEAIKPVVSGDFIVEKPEEKARAKDRRSAKTGVRAGGRAPTSTVDGGSDSIPDPMTYALEEVDEELGSQDDDEEVVYQNHQVHHNVINHSQANRTQGVEDSRRQQQYNRGYSRGTSGGSYATGGGRSFEERSDADFSETASSAQYYAQNQGRSFMSTSSRGESFDEYR